MNSKLTQYKRYNLYPVLAERGKNIKYHERCVLTSASPLGSADMRGIKPKQLQKEFEDVSKGEGLRKPIYFMLLRLNEPDKVFLCVGLTSWIWTSETKQICPISHYLMVSEPADRRLTKLHSSLPSLVPIYLIFLLHQDSIHSRNRGYRDVQLQKIYANI